MSLADPITVTISAVPITLPRVATGEHESEYLSGDGLYRVETSHSYGKERTRRMARINAVKIAPDPFRESENVERSMSFYWVFDLPDWGYTPVEAKAVADGFNTFLTASSGAVITKLLGGES